VNVRALFVAHPQSPELIQPNESPFDRPSPSPQSAAMLGVALRKKRDDASFAQNPAGLTQRHSHGRPLRNQDDGVVVLALPASLGWHQPVRALAASRYDWIRSVEWREELPVRRRSDDVCCPAWPVGRVRSRLPPPKAARIELPSTTSSDQSISP